VRCAASATCGVCARRNSPRMRPARPSGAAAELYPQSTILYRDRLQQGRRLVRIDRAASSGATASAKCMDLYFKRHAQPRPFDDRGFRPGDGRCERRRFSALPPLVPPGRHARGSRSRTAMTPRRGRYELTLRQETQPTPGQPAKEPLVMPLAGRVFWGRTAREMRLTQEGGGALDAERGATDPSGSLSARRRRCRRCCAAFPRRCG